MNIFSFFNQKKACSTGETQGVTILTGDPKKAIISLSGPMIIAMLLMSSYNIVNAIWVVGLGSDALAAVGFMTPLYMVLMGLGTGIGAGATSAIARRIGANDHNGANNCAVHTLLIALILSVIVTLPLVIFAEQIALLFGAGETAGLAAAYGQVLFAGSFFILFVNIAYGILRAEGDARRTMHAMVAASLLNIILDPILIYGLGLGIAGAAWGTIISLAAATIVLCYWFFIKKDTYVCFSRQVFIPSRSVVSNILSVGIPASVEYLLMSALNIILNLILVMVATTDAVAVFSVGFRVVSFGIVPIVAIGTSVVSVVGAAYGARHYEKIRVAHTFSIIFGLAIALSAEYPYRDICHPYCVCLLLFTAKRPPLSDNCHVYRGHVLFLSLCTAGSPVVFRVPGCRERTDIPFPDVHEKPCVCRNLCVPVRNPSGHGRTGCLVGDSHRGSCRGSAGICLGSRIHFTIRSKDKGSCPHGNA